MGCTQDRNRALNTRGVAIVPNPLYTGWPQRINQIDRNPLSRTLGYASWGGESDYTVGFNGP
jgi:hypothetical protein